MGGKKGELRGNKFMLTQYGIKIEVMGSYIFLAFFPNIEFQQQKEITESGQWFQGIFDVDSEVRAKRSTRKSQSKKKIERELNIGRKVCFFADTKSNHFANKPILESSFLIFHTNQSKAIKMFQRCACSQTQLFFVNRSFLKIRGFGRFRKPKWMIASKLFGENYLHLRL